MKKIILSTILILALTACSMYAVVDTSEAIIVTQKLSKNKYKCEYYYSGTKYFMHVISEEDMEVGDTLSLKLKS